MATTKIRMLSINALYKVSTKTNSCLHISAVTVKITEPLLHKAHTTSQRLLPRNQILFIIAVLCGED